MTADGATPIGVDFPLRGEWTAVNSPADRVPSHGTDMLAQRYAYDFIRTDRRPGWHVHPAGRLRTFLLGVPVRECYAWGRPVHVPFDGVVVQAEDGWPERQRLVPIRDVLLAVKNGLTFDPRRGLGPVTGNHVVVRSGEVHAAFVHLAPGSVRVEPGQSVRAGEIVGRVGHTGNSTMPHLHFQLMDGPDPLTAAGVACAFNELEVERGGRWELVRDHVPRRGERIRYGADDPTVSAGDSAG